MAKTDLATVSTAVARKIIITGNRALHEAGRPRFEAGFGELQPRTSSAGEAGNATLLTGFEAAVPAFVERALMAHCFSGEEAASVSTATFTFADFNLFKMKSC